MMDIKGLYNRLAQSPLSIRIATLAVVAMWGLVLVAFIAFAILLLEQPTYTQPPTQGEATPAIALDPGAGLPGTTVRVRGEGWKPGTMVLIYLIAPSQAEPPSYAIAGLNADALGQFTTGFVVPTGTDWENQGLATVMAREIEGGAVAQAFFGVLSPPTQPAATSVVPVEPTATPTQVMPPSPTATPQPEIAMATATTDLNIRGGPGTAYPVLGVLRAGQSAEITGISADGGWWQIRFSGTSDGRGWLSARYVTARDTGNVPVVQSPPLPATQIPAPTATPTPTSTPVVITDWRGEYYSNPQLSGDPVLVRNDIAISFDWGTGSPGSGLPVDDFSVRWSRGLSFSAGTYRFYARVDDGVRLWLDGDLVIDQWHDSAPTTYSADVTLTGGWHNLRMEYYERGGGALAQLSWERLEHYPDWKAQYYDNRKLEGDPVLVRNETEIDHNWGNGSPGDGVPVDNFSARWTREVDFKSGTYVVRVRVDDGVRLWFDDTLVIDSWTDGSARWIEKERWVSGGEHRVKVEYYEHNGAARIEVSWEREGQSNQPPQAVPGGSYTVDEGSQVTFQGGGSRDPDGSIVKYEWDFNYDGRVFITDATGEKVGNRYPDGPETVTVALRVTDDKGASDMATTWVQVKNVAPTAEAGGPYNGQVGSLISMAGTATDPGSVDQAGLTYRWDFGDGTTGSGPMVSHSYAQPRDYTVTLTVTDKDGAQDTDTATVQVTRIPQPPVAVISGPTRGLVGETLSFDGSGSSDSDGSIVSYAWDFGDGTSGSGASVTHSYSTAGTYQVSLTVTDDDGLTGETTHVVQVDEPAPMPQPPVAVISGPASGLVGEALNFNGGGSSDSDGSIVSYVWDFGDATSGSGASVTHSYSTAGTYQVSLTVTDDDGLTGETTHVVQVDEPAPMPQPPVAVISGPTSGLVGETLSFDGSGSSDSDGSIVSYDWDFGGGTVSSGITVTHVYTQTGDYQVTLTVTDDDGLTASTGHMVQVEG
jgi:PKD repeat protein